MNERFEEYKALLADEYRRNRAKGMDFHPAKQASKDADNAAYPDIGALLQAAMRTDENNPDTTQGRRMASSMSGFWKVLQNEFGDNDAPIAATFAPTDPPSTNGNGNGRAEVAPRLMCMLKRIGIKTGDVWALGNLDGLTALIGCSDSSILSALITQPNGPIQRAGYRFEGMNTPRHDCKVKCIQSPRTQEEIERDAIATEVERARQAFEAFMADASVRLAKLGK